MSRGERVDGIQIYQYENDITVNGIGIDRDESFGDEGWWNTLEGEVEEYMLKPEDANKIIRFCPLDIL